MHARDEPTTLALLTFKDEAGLMRNGRRHNFVDYDIVSCMSWDDRGVMRFTGCTASTRRPYRPRLPHPPWTQRLL
jgi:hypothetical protein